MANLFDWYYRQIVTQGEMDQAFQWMEDADRAFAEDWALTGIVSGLTIAEQAPPAMAVNLAGPGVAYGSSGERVAVDAPVTVVPCNVDEFGVATAVMGAGNERWLSVFVVPTRRYASPAVDGNSVTVYTRQYEDYAIVVDQASEQLIGANVKPALRADAVLSADIQLQFGDTAIPNSRISYLRTQTWINQATTNIGTCRWPTPRWAVQELIAMVDYISAASGVAYTPGQTWADSGALSGPSAPVSTIGEGLDAIIYDLARTTGTPGAHRVGVAAHATTGSYCNMVAGPLQHVLESIADAVAGHINGGAPAHPASSVTFSDTAMEALWTETLAWTTVQEAIDGLAISLGLESVSHSGARRIGAEALGTGMRFNFSADTLLAQLQRLADYTDGQGRLAYDEMTAEGWCVPCNRGDSGPLTATDPYWAARAFGSVDANLYTPAGGPHPWSNGNQITTSNLINAIAPCLQGDHVLSHIPSFIAVGPALNEYVYLWSARAGECEAVNQVAVANLPSTAHLYAVVADPAPIGTCGVIVLGTKTADSPQAYIWKINTSNVGTPYAETTGGWTASGVALTGCTLATSVSIDANRIYSAGNYIVAVCAGEDAAGTPICRITNSNPATQSAGKGNAGATFNTIHGSCYVPWCGTGMNDKIAFFTSTGAVRQLCFADFIAPTDTTPERATGEALTPITYVTNKNVYSCAWDGGYLWFMDEDGNVGLFSPWVANEGTDQAHAYQETVLVNTLADAGNLHRMAFDGVNMNFIVLADHSASASFLVHQDLPCRAVRLGAGSVDIGAAGAAWCYKGPLNAPVSTSTGETIVTPGPVAIGFNTLVYVPATATQQIRMVYPLHH